MWRAARSRCRGGGCPSSPGPRGAPPGRPPRLGRALCAPAPPARIGALGREARMTPFGARVRALRRERGLMLKDMAAYLGVSSAYLSALERGERGKPTWTLLQGVLHYFHIIWD